jgi:hypothetical protein
MEASLASFTSCPNWKKRFFKGTVWQAFAGGYRGFLSLRMSCPNGKKEVFLKGQSHKHLLEANGGFLSLMRVLPPTGKEVCLKEQPDKHLLEANGGFPLQNISLASCTFYNPKGKKRCV